MNDDADECATKIAALRDALDAGIAELDAGLGVETSPEELIADIVEALGLAH